MAGDVKVEAQKLVAAGENIKTQRDRIKGLLDEAKGIVKNLSSWEGDAKDNFLAAFTDLENSFNAAYELISSYITFLNDAATEYSKAEADRANDNASFEDN